MDPPTRSPIEAQHRRSLLRIVLILEILAGGIECQELLEQSVVSRKLDHGAPGLVPADHVASLEQMVQKNPGLSIGTEKQSSD